MTELHPTTALFLFLTLLAACGDDELERRLTEAQRG